MGTEGSTAYSRIKRDREVDEKRSNVDKKPYTDVESVPLRRSIDDQVRDLREVVLNLVERIVTKNES